MAVVMNGKYLGNKKVELLHEPSGMIIRTSAPKDNNGDGSSFSPTDLCAASLGACMLTVVGIVAERDSVDLTGSHFTIEKHMAEAPRRIAKLPLTFHLPKSLSEVHRRKFEAAAKTCPVHHSLHPQIEVILSFNYDVE